MRQLDGELADGRAFPTREPDASVQRLFDGAPEECVEECAVLLGEAPPLRCPGLDHDPAADRGDRGVGADDEPVAGPGDDGALEPELSPRDVAWSELVPFEEHDAAHDLGGSEVEADPLALPEGPGR